MRRSGRAFGRRAGAVCVGAPLVGAPPARPKSPAAGRDLANCRRGTHKGRPYACIRGEALGLT
jgi:hypothetical protein